MSSKIQIPSSLSYLLISLSILFSQSLSIHVAAQTSLENLVICKNRGQVRTIRVQPKSGAFFTYYSKFGKESEVGQGVNKDGQLKIRNNIKDNLEAAAWQCREVGQATSLEV